MTATLFAGGRVHVGDGTTAEALLARDGRVAAVGRFADLARDAGRAERVDIRGGLMTPGWVDAHVHFMWWAIQMGRIDLREVASLDDALARIDAFARRLPEGAWLLGGRFDKNLWGRWPTARELDAVSHGHPAALRSRDGHSLWANGEALRRGAVRGASDAPPGGAIEIGPDGVPSGILKENAKRLVDDVIPPPDDEECVTAIRSGQTEAWRRGVTGIEDLEDARARRAFERLEGAGELGLRVEMGIAHADLDEALARRARTGDGDGMLRTGHLKLFSDGALGSQTAALEEPYLGSADRGILTIEPERLDADVARAARAGIAVAIHAIGDRAVRVALDAIERARPISRALRHRIEHVQLVREEDFARFASTGTIASMQPIHATSDRDLADRYWGPGRTPRAYPWRTLRRRGVVLAFGSDAPVEPIDPLLGIHAAVARQRRDDTGPWHPEQALTLDEALAGYSAGSAYAAAREREAGALAPGMRCDATVVDRDLAALPPAEWLGATVRATIVEGRVRHAAGLG